LIVALGATGARAQAAKKADPDKLPVTRIRDLHYGDVLFWFYQEQSFEALTRLTAYGEWRRLPNHEAESQLLLGGLYLELGMHNEAGARFEKLLSPTTPANVRNRAWFYLGKVWYARGYLDRAEQAVRKVEGKLPRDLDAERMHLLANILMRQNRFAEAAALLGSWQGPTSWTAYAQFNLGVALVRDGRLEEADRWLTQVGLLESDRKELLDLRDKANLALGFAYLQAQRPENARPVLERVRLNGPYSNKALLGVGWADASMGRYREALVPWLELHDRNLLDAAVQEAYLAVPFAFAKQDANSQAVEYYESAVKSFDEEQLRLDDSIARIGGGSLLDTIIAKEAQGGGTYGFFWQLKTLPEAPESRYLYTLLAGHDFQEGLKNYRDLVFLDGRLTSWYENLDVYADMIRTRDIALAERLPRADAFIASGKAEALAAGKNGLRSQLEDVERLRDVGALGSDQERAQWARIRNLEQALANAPDTEETLAQKERLRLLKGVLSWRLEEAYRGRVYLQRRGLRELEATINETQSRLERLLRARESVPQNTGAFAGRLEVINARLESLRARLAAARTAQSTYLAGVAIKELESQKERLGTYQLQARFALATIYDRAASAAPSSDATAAPAADPDAEPPK
jgi:hypothetical protein